MSNTENIMENWVHDTLAAIGLSEISLETARAELERCAADLARSRWVDRVSSAILDEIDDDDDAIDEMVCEGIEYELAGAIVRLDRSLVGR
jgi:uncharacterized protein YgfB (UPF0149 family)